MERKALILGLLIGWIMVPGLADGAERPGQMVPVKLRCEYLENPEGIETARPRLYWQLVSGLRDQAQSGYRILVATDAEKLTAGQGDMWDSGKVISGQTTHIEYEGKALESGRKYYWKVWVWDQKGRLCPESETAWWSMGLLEPEDWQGGWISFRDEMTVRASQKQVVLPPARYYRKTFRVSKPVKRAMWYATALGIYEPRLNGQAVTRAKFLPGWSDYKKRVYYNSFDVTSKLVRGENVLGTILADGWYSGYVGYGLLVGYGPNRCGRYFYGKTPAWRCQLEIEYRDGSRERIVSDGSWKVAAGPEREADILMGETYDARRELNGWDQSGYDDREWEAVVPAEVNGPLKMDYYDAGGHRQVELGFEAPARMQSYPGVMVKPSGQIKAKQITEPAPGVYIINLGQNFSGVVRLKAKAPAGTRVRLRYGEMVHLDGRLMTENLRKARATDTYIFKGDPEGEVWVPRFTYHGFQYVEVTGLKRKPTLDTITGIVLHSDTPFTSLFHCSDEMVNQLYHNIIWTQRSNFFEVPTDCPQRDERLGWMGDAQIYVRAATYNADVAAFFTKWMDDVEEAQRPEGPYTDYSPYPMQHGGRKAAYGTAWMDAGIICPWTLYRVYGDTRMIARHYKSMQRFIQWREENSPNRLGTRKGNDWGDWLCIGEKTPIEYIDTVYNAATAAMMAEMAEAIGQADDGQGYRKLAEAYKAAFRGEYVRNDGRLKVETQTAYVLALYFDLLEEPGRTTAAAKLAAMIRENGGKMTTGFLGTRPLLPVLTQTGYGDLAAALLQSREYPSWGYEVVNGATSIWERWDSFTREKGFGNAAMNSFSHYSFGAVGEWLFGYLAGIDAGAPGYRTIVIKPRVPQNEGRGKVEPIHVVSAQYDSIAGTISSQWRRLEDRFELTVQIPVNTTGLVSIPTRNPSSVRERGRALDEVDEVNAVGTAEGYLTMEVRSGLYHFSSQL